MYRTESLDRVEDDVVVDIGTTQPNKDVPKNTNRFNDSHRKK